MSRLRRNGKQLIEQRRNLDIERRDTMTDNEKELVATIKLSMLRAIVDLDEETLLNLVKKVLEESENKVRKGCRYDDGEPHAECVLCDKAGH